MDYYYIQEGHVLTIYHDLEFKEENVDIEITIVVKELKDSNGELNFKELEEISYVATVICNGSYDKVLPEGEAHLATWIEENGSPTYFKGKFSPDGGGYNSTMTRVR